VSLDIYQVAEAFSNHRFAATYTYMAAGIKWNIVGREELLGREALINAPRQRDSSRRLD